MSFWSINVAKTTLMVAFLLGLFMSQVKKMIYHFHKYYCCHDHNYSGCNFLQIFTCLIAYGTFYEICFSRFVSGRTLSVIKINVS